MAKGLFYKQSSHLLCDTDTKYSIQISERMHVSHKIVIDQKKIVNKKKTSK